MTLLLIGPIGAGKTSIGSSLAQKLNLKFYEMDERIRYFTNHSQQSPVGESEWKECQLEISKDLSTQDDIVIACSGDIIENSLNLTYFQENSNNLEIIYLEADEKTLSDRIRKNNSELDQKTLAQKIQSLIEARQSLYQSWATLTIQTKSFSLDQVVNKILSHIKAN
jgi:shikimate kinase